MGGQATGSVAFAGLGAMGFGMASHLLKKSYTVIGFDVYAPTLDKFRAVGGDTATSPREAAKGKSIFVCMVANSQQAESVLFDISNGAVQGKYYSKDRDRS
jgi:3-hydroxyisobutyrate dehydrogenase